LSNEIEKGLLNKSLFYIAESLTFRLLDRNLGRKYQISKVCWNHESNDANTRDDVAFKANLCVWR